MKHYFLFLVFVATLLGAKVPAFATANNPTSVILQPADDHPKNIATMKLKDFQRLSGRKLTFKEKIGFLVMRHKMRHQKTGADPLGIIAYILGLVAIVFLIVGLIGLLYPLIVGSFAAAILAILTGSIANKDGADKKKAKAGKWLGWITLGVLAILAGIVIILSNG